MLHVTDAAKEYTSVTIRTVDSDVVVLAVYVFGQLSTSLTELWVAFGTGKNYRMISAHGIYVVLLSGTLSLYPGLSTRFGQKS